MPGAQQLASPQPRFLPLLPALQQAAASVRGENLAIKRGIYTRKARRQNRGLKLSEELIVASNLLRLQHLQELFVPRAAERFRRENAAPGMPHVPLKAQNVSAFSSCRGNVTGTGAETRWGSSPQSSQAASGEERDIFQMNVLNCDMP